MRMDRKDLIEVLIKPLLVIFLILLAFGTSELLQNNMDEPSSPSKPIQTSEVQTSTPSYIQRIIIAPDSASEAIKDTADFVCSEENDVYVIQNAIDSLPSEGGEIFLLRGIYNFKGDIILRQDISLRGEEEKSTILNFITNNGILSGNNGSNIQMVDFTVTGKGRIIITDSDVLLKHITVYDVDNSFIACFVINADNEVIERVVFDHCNAVDCDRWGFLNSGNNEQSIIKNCQWIACQAINCGRYGQYTNGWDVGFDITENIDVENLIYQDCIAKGCWESGFHAETLPDIRNVTLINCFSENNAQKEKTGSGKCIFGAGFIIVENMKLESCISKDNLNGFLCTEGGSQVINCSDYISDVGFRIFNISNSLTITSCTVRNSPHPVLIWTKQMNNVVIDNINIISDKRPKPISGILIDPLVRNAQEITIRNSIIQGYTIGINNQAKLGLVKVENVTVVDADNDFVNCYVQ